MKKEKKQELTPQQIEAARQARNEYARRWRERNPERSKEYQLRYWQRVAQRGGVKVE